MAPRAIAAKSRKQRRVSADKTADSALRFAYGKAIAKRQSYKRNIIVSPPPPAKPPLPGRVHSSRLPLGILPVSRPPACALPQKTHDIDTLLPFRHRCRKKKASNVPRHVRHFSIMSRVRSTMTLQTTPRLAAHYDIGEKSHQTNPDKYMYHLQNGKVHSFI